MGCGASKHAEPVDSHRPVDPPVPPVCPPDPKPEREYVPGRETMLLTQAQAYDLGLNKNLLDTVNKGRTPEVSYVIEGGALALRVRFAYDDQLITVLPRQDHCQEGGRVGLVVILDIPSGTVLSTLLVSFPTSTFERDRLVHYATFEGDDLEHTVDLDALVTAALGPDAIHPSSLKDVDKMEANQALEVELSKYQDVINKALRAADERLEVHPCRPVLYHGLLVVLASFHNQPDIHGSHLVVIDVGQGRVVYDEPVSDESSIVLGHHQKGLGKEDLLWYDGKHPKQQQQQQQQHEQSGPALAQQLQSADNDDFQAPITTQHVHTSTAGLGAICNGTFISHLYLAAHAAASRDDHFYILGNEDLPDHAGTVAADMSKGGGGETADDGGAGYTGDWGRGPLGRRTHPPPVPPPFFPPSTPRPSPGHLPPADRGGTPPATPNAPDLPPSTVPTAENLITGRAVAWTMASSAPIRLLAGPGDTGKTGRQSIYVEPTLASSFTDGICRSTIELYVRPKQSSQTIDILQRVALTNSNVRRAKVTVTIDPHANTVHGEISTNAYVAREDAPSEVLDQFSFSGVFPTSVTAATEEANQWAHVAVVFGPTSTHNLAAQLYVDGALHGSVVMPRVNTTTLQSKLRAVTGHTWVYEVGLQGTSQLNQSATWGTEPTFIDEVRIWSSSRSLLEINQTISSRVLHHVPNLASHLMGFMPINATTGAPDYSKDPNITSCHAHGNGMWYRHVQEIETYRMKGYDTPPKLINIVPEELDDSVVVGIRAANSLLYLNAKSDGHLQLGKAGFSQFHPDLDHVDAVGGAFYCTIPQGLNSGRASTLGVDIRLRSVLDGGPMSNDKPYMAMSSTGAITWVSAAELGTSSWHLHGAYLQYHSSSTDATGWYLGQVGGHIVGTRDASMKLAVYVDKIRQDYVKWDIGLWNTHDITVHAGWGTRFTVPIRQRKNLYITPMISYQCSKDAPYPARPQDPVTFQDTYTAMVKVKTDPLDTSSKSNHYTTGERNPHIKFGIRTKATTTVTAIVNGETVIIPASTSDFHPVITTDGELHVSFAKPGHIISIATVPEFEVTVLNLINPDNGTTYHGLWQRQISWPVRFRTGLRQNLPAMKGSDLAATVDPATTSANRFTSTGYQNFQDILAVGVSTIAPGVGKFVVPAGASGHNHLLSNGKAGSHPPPTKSRFHSMSWGSFWHSVSHAIKNGVHVISHAVNSVVSAAVNVVRKGIEVIVDGASQIVKGLQKMGEMIGNIYDSIKAGLSKAWNAFADWVAQQLGFTDLKHAAEGIKSFSKHLLPSMFPQLGTFLTSYNTSILQPMFGQVNSTLNTIIQDAGLSDAAYDLEHNEGSSENTLFGGLLHTGKKIAGTLGSIIMSPLHFAAWLVNWVMRKIMSVLGSGALGPALDSAFTTALSSATTAAIVSLKTATQAHGSGSGASATHASLTTALNALLVGDIKHKGAAVFELLKIGVSGLATLTTEVVSLIATISSAMETLIVAIMDTPVLWGALTSLLNHILPGYDWSFSLLDLQSWIIAGFLVPTMKLHGTYATTFKPVFDKQRGSSPYLNGTTNRPNWTSLAVRQPGSGTTPHPRPPVIPGLIPQSPVTDAFKKCKMSVDGAFALAESIVATAKLAYSAYETLEVKGVMSGKYTVSNTFLGMKLLGLTTGGFSLWAYLEYGVPDTPANANARNTQIATSALTLARSVAELGIRGYWYMQEAAHPGEIYYWWKMLSECGCITLFGAAGIINSSLRYHYTQSVEGHEEGISRLANSLLMSAGDFVLIIPLFLPETEYVTDEQVALLMESPVIETLFAAQTVLTLGAAGYGIYGVIEEQGWV